MYLPSSELQQFNGQWMCPYCLQDARDENRKATEYKHKKDPVRVLSYPERCERCGRDLEGRVYIWNGKKLCKRCLGDEQDSWTVIGGGPMAAPQRVSVNRQKKGTLRLMFEAFFAKFLALFGIKVKMPVSEIVVYHTKMPISRATPMAESTIATEKKTEENQESPPQIEGIIKKQEKKQKQKKKGNRKGASFPDFSENSGQNKDQTKKQNAEKVVENPFRSYKEKKKKQ